MTYPAFEHAIETKLRKCSAGLTWKELRDTLDLPYDRACPEWTRRLENEIGLDRAKVAGRGRAWVWRVGKRK